MAIRTITLYSPFLGIVSGSGDANLTLEDVDDNFFEVPDQTGNNQTALLDGSPVTINSIQTAVGPQLITALVDGVSVDLSLTPVRVIVEDGFIDDSYVYFPGLPDGAEITLGLSLPLAFPEDVAVPLCLSADTLIRAETGLRAIGQIKAGDMIETFDEGLQEVLWVGKRHLNFRSTPGLAKHKPILVRQNAFGLDQPYRDLVLSPQHCIVFDSWEASYLSGEDAVMVPAINLVNGNTVVQLEDCEQVDYCHLLFKDHQVFWAHGMTVESLYLGDLALDSLASDRCTELLEIFPDITGEVAKYHTRARPRLNSPEAAVLMHTLQLQSSPWSSEHA